MASDTVTIPRSALGFDGLMGVPRGRAPRRGGGPGLVSGYVQAKKKGQKDAPKAPGEDLIKRRHPDWTENFLRWRFLLDSYEGGQRYRDASYGMDRFGRPNRNLLRHKREYPDSAEYPNTYQGWAGYAGSGTGLVQQAGMGPFPGQLGADPFATAGDDEYEYRRARTPVPPFTEEAVEAHTAKIYDQEVRREGPDGLVEWWADVDNAGTSINDWMREILSPNGLVLGCIDVVMDRPVVPKGVVIETRADEEEYDQDKVVASIIAPENMVWYRTDPAGNYLECLVSEHDSPDDPATGPDEPPQTPTTDSGEPLVRGKTGDRYRHWTQTEVALYDGTGQVVEAARPHGYPFLPIVRLVDKRRLRKPHVGKSRYEAIAEYQREFYNRDSELIFSDSLQAHPSLMGDEEYCQSEKVLTVGPGNILPIKHHPDGTVVPWQYVSPPKDPAASLRTNKQDIEDLKDRHAGIAKPAGMTGTTGGTVSQSGFSKMFDEDSGNRIIGDISKTLARWERVLAEFALMVKERRRLTQDERAAIRISYPSRFQLKAAGAILNEMMTFIQAVAMEAQVVMASQEPPAVGASAIEKDESQDGGNPVGPRLAAPTDGTTAAPSPAAPLGVPARDFAPTRLIPWASVVAAQVGEYVKAAFAGRNREFFDQVDRESKAFLLLHMLPDIGVDSDIEAMAGRGSEEQLSQQDRLGESASTAVSSFTPIS